MVTGVRSKIELRGDRTQVKADAAADLVTNIFVNLGCAAEIARELALHLVDSSLSGVESHGVMRILQYAEQFKSGYMKAAGLPQVRQNGHGAILVDGGGGIGIPAMRMAYEEGMERARASGISVVAVCNVGHTGRHGAFADKAGEKGFVTILLGGGNRRLWRQVAPHGGAKAMLPTNPYCLGVPGGQRGPVVLDFATSKIAGGWIYAAKSANALLPEGCVVDKHGNPTRNPDDYFDGGAILPAGEHKGYGLALVAELVAEAVLGPVRAEANWLLVSVRANQFNSDSKIAAAAEEVLSEMRGCPPAPGSSGVEIPGERERNYHAASGGTIQVPSATWQQMLRLLEQTRC